MRNKSPSGLSTPSFSSPPTQILSALYPGYDDDSTNEGYNEASVRSRTISARLGRALKKSSSSLWNFFAQKSGRLSETKSEKKKEVQYTTATYPLFPSQNFGSLGTMSGCWMSSEIETRMVLAEHEHECNSEGGVQSGSAFQFRHMPRPQWVNDDNEEGCLDHEKGNRQMLMRMKSMIVGSSCQGRAEQEWSDPEWRGVDNKSGGTTLALARALCLDLLLCVWLRISERLNYCQESRR